MGRGFSLRFSLYFSSSYTLQMILKLYKSWHMVPKPGINLKIVHVGTLYEYTAHLFSTLVLSLINLSMIYEYLLFNTLYLVFQSVLFFPELFLHIKVIENHTCKCVPQTLFRVIGSSLFPNG